MSTIQQTIRIIKFYESQKSHKRKTKAGEENKTRRYTKFGNMPTVATSVQYGINRIHTQVLSLKIQQPIPKI